MKKVVMNVSIAGNDFSYAPGQEVELEDGLAKSWSEIGHCALMDQEKKRGGKNADKS